MTNSENSVPPTLGPKCCREYKCKRAKPILVRRTGLTGRWVVITDYSDRGDGIIIANTKHDVNDDLMGYLGSQGWIEPEGVKRITELLMKFYDATPDEAIVAQFSADEIKLLEQLDDERKS